MQKGCTIDVKIKRTLVLLGSSKGWCRRGDLNPHGRKAHCALNAARLPNSTTPALSWRSET